MSGSGCSWLYAWQVVYPLISLVGGIFVWVGVWDYIVDYLHGQTAGYDAMYMLCGLALLLLTRTLIAQAGLKPVTFHPSTINNTASSHSLLPSILAFLANTAPARSSGTSNSAVLYSRSLLALLAGITFWLGAYNLFDVHLFEYGHVERDLAYTAVGLALMFLTSNVTSEGSLIADSAEPSHAASSNAAHHKPLHRVIHTAQAFLLYHVKALVGLYGDVVYWVGAYNLADIHVWEATPTRDSLYVVFGLCVFFGLSLWTWRERTQAKVQRAAVREGGAFEPLAGGSAGAQHGGQNEWSDRLAFYVRCGVAMVAGVLVWVGWWNILSSWVVSDTVATSLADDGSTDGEAAASNVRRLLALDMPSHAHSQRFHVLQRSSSSESSAFPMWVLYAVYAFTGLVFLIVTNTFTSQAGVIQPLGLIRQQANVGVAAEAAADAESGTGPAQADSEQIDVEATQALNHALPSL